MNHLSLRPSWRQWPLPAVLAGLIMAGGAPVSAQLEKKLDKNVRQYLSVNEQPEFVLSLITSVVDHYDNGEYPQAITALNSILAGDGREKPNGSLRAWTYQWLALNHSAAKDSITVVKKYVQLSLDADVEIWREYAEFARMPRDLREIYQECWNSLQEQFNKKRHSWRLGLGTISRLDYGYRTETLEVLGGLGAPIVADLASKKIKFNQLLLYARLQRVRRSIERIFGGYYVEFSFLEENLNDNKLNAPQKLKFTPSLSAGAALGYANKSSWELGASFEVARLLFKKSDSDKKGDNSQSGGIDFSQTTKINDWPLLYGNFEFYVRKWF